MSLAHQNSEEVPEDSEYIAFSTKYWVDSSVVKGSPPVCTYTRASPKPSCPRLREEKNPGNVNIIVAFFPLIIVTSLVVAPNLTDGVE
jgi:hypothetical protein